MRQIRRGVFETNSSSVHSITMCMEDKFEKFRKGMLWRFSDYFYDDYDLHIEADQDGFVSPDQVRKALASCKDYQGPDPYELSDAEIFEICDGWFESYSTLGHNEFETFEDKFTTPNGETVVAFGFYGHD